ncbi:MAG: hypothetical protein EXR98_23235 [Gemmataceae bacterium]|nr:hypothetical protein [Gemmataceae bacterium]
MSMPRFVILEHDHPIPHCDLMLEAGDALQTWRLAQPPEVQRIIESTALDDHRVMYLDYEGPVSGNRGSVKRWDVGDFTEEQESTPTARLLSMQGARIHGHVRLEQIDGKNWRFVWLTR